MKSIFSSLSITLLLVMTHSLALANSANDHVNKIIITKNSDQLSTIDLLVSMISYKEQVLTRKVGGSGKPKYIDSNGTVVAKIKHYDGSKIKIKDANGNLLWKLKIKSSHFKLADNEEMSNAYKLEKSTSTSTKNYSSGQLIGGTKKVGNEYTIVNGSDKYTLVFNGDVYAGIIGYDDIPLMMRLIIINELLVNN